MWDNLHLVKIRYRAKTTSFAIVCATTLAAYMYVRCSTSHCRYVRYHFVTWNTTNVTVWPWLTIKFHFHFTTLPFRDDTISRKAIEKWRGHKMLWVDMRDTFIKVKTKVPHIFLLYSFSKLVLDSYVFSECTFRGYLFSRSCVQQLTTLAKLLTSDKNK